MLNDGNSTSSLLETALSVLAQNPTAIMTALRTLVQSLPLFNHPGFYDVLEHEATLELSDHSGKTALYSKRQVVRFTQDNIIAYQDQAWGDGDIFAKYKCSPGVAVDRYREGNRYRVLISLRMTKNKGDEAEFRVERRIKDGFTKPEEELQADIDHKTKHALLRVIFPRERWAKQIALLTRNGTRTTSQPATDVIELPGKRQQVEWSIDNPAEHHAYVVHWQW